MKNVINQKQVSEKLKLARLKKGLSVPEVAEALNVSRQTVYNWEKDASRIPLRTFTALSDLYGVKTLYFFT